MVMHTSAETSDISIVKESQKNISDPSRAHALIDNVKDRKHASKRNWTGCENCVQDSKYVHKNQ